MCVCVYERFTYITASVYHRCAWSSYLTVTIRFLIGIDARARGVYAPIRNRERTYSFELSSGRGVLQCTGMLSNKRRFNETIKTKRKRIYTRILFSIIICRRGKNNIKKNSIFSIFIFLLFESSTARRIIQCGIVIFTRSGIPTPFYYVARAIRENILWALCKGNSFNNNKKQ